MSATFSVIVLDSPATTCTGGRYEITADGTGGLQLAADDQNTGFVAANASPANVSSMFKFFDK